MITWEACMNPKVVIILVNYNGFDDTLECIRSLQNISYDNYQIVVVDNASTEKPSDNQKIFLIENSVFIESKINCGFSGGNNIGIEYARKNGAKYVLLLNNDTIVEPDFLNVLVDVAEHKTSVGIVGGKIRFFNEPNKLWFGGGAFDRKTCSCVHVGCNTIDTQNDYKIKEITFMTGCLMLIPLKVIENVGRLDDSYFLYAEDTDYCCRVIDAGYKIYYVNTAVIYHKINASTGRINNIITYYIVRNNLKLIQKYGYTKIKIYISFTWKIVKDIVKRRKSFYPVFYGYIDFIKNKTGQWIR